MALLTKGVELIHVSHPTGKTMSGVKEDRGTLIPDLLEVGELKAGSAGSERDKVEVTTLADDKHMYIDGLISDNESDSIGFKFLYKSSIYNGFLAMAAEEETMLPVHPEGSTWAVYLPDGSYFTIKGTCSVKLDSVAVNSPLTMSVEITPKAEITFTPAPVGTGE